LQDRGVRVAKVMQPDRRQRVLAAAILNYDRRTICKAIEAGEIPATRAGATWRVPTAWLLKLARLGTDGGGDTA